MEIKAEAALWQEVLPFGLGTHCRSSVLWVAEVRYDWILQKV